MSKTRAGRQRRREKHFEKKKINKRPSFSLKINFYDDDDDDDAIVVLISFQIPECGEFKKPEMESFLMMMS